MAIALEDNGSYVYLHYSKMLSKQKTNFQLVIKKISKEYDLKSAKYIEPWPYIVFNLLAVDKLLTNMIHATIIQQKFPENAKITRGTPIYKNTKDGSRLELTN